MAIDSFKQIFQLLAGRDPNSLSKEKELPPLTLEELFSLFKQHDISIHPALRRDQLMETIDALRSKINSFENPSLLQIVLTHDFQDGIRVVRLSNNEIGIGTYNAFLDADSGVIKGREGKRIREIGKLLNHRKLEI